MVFSRVALTSCLGNNRPRSVSSAVLSRSLRQTLAAFSYDPGEALAPDRSSDPGAALRSRIERKGAAIAGLREGRPAGSTHVTLTSHLDGAHTIGARTPGDAECQHVGRAGLRPPECEGEALTIPVLPHGVHRRRELVDRGVGAGLADAGSSEGVLLSTHLQVDFHRERRLGLRSGCSPAGGEGYRDGEKNGTRQHPWTS